jgi:hypothetical protein
MCYWVNLSTSSTGFSFSCLRAPWWKIWYFLLWAMIACSGIKNSTTDWTSKLLLRACKFLRFNWRIWCLYFWSSSSLGDSLMSVALRCRSGLKSIPWLWLRPWCQALINENVFLEDLSEITGLINYALFINYVIFSTCISDGPKIR